MRRSCGLIGDGIFGQALSAGNLTPARPAMYNQRAHHKKFMNLQRHGLDKNNVLIHPVWGT
jgi:hypothetical protein